MSKKIRTSALSVSQQQGKQYDWKHDCEFCYTRFDTSISDAFNPKVYCSKDCELLDEELPKQYFEHKANKGKHK